MFALSSCDVHPDVTDAISNSKLLLPIDTSVFLFGTCLRILLKLEKDYQQSVAFMQSQIDIAKRMNVVAVPAALICGKVC